MTVVKDNPFGEGQIAYTEDGTVYFFKESDFKKKKCKTCGAITISGGHFHLKPFSPSKVGGKDE